MQLVNQFRHTAQHNKVSGAILAVAMALVGSIGFTMPASAAPLLSVAYASQATGHDSTTCGSILQPCRTINQAIGNVMPNGTVIVEPGTYTEQVILNKMVRLIGQNATVDATDHLNGITIGDMRPGSNVAAGSMVNGFTIKNAQGEGILAANTTGLTLLNNVVSANDKGVGTNISPACAPQGEVPGDCGEGIHLMSTNNSRVLGNTVTSNLGGILLTDELGPNHGNLIANNRVADNTEDCGITLPSHSTTAVSSTGMLQPNQGGVYSNRVVGNTITNNGTGEGGGAGVLIAAAAPGGASYNNSIIGNSISGNGLSGITVHAHAPNQNVSGNSIIGNVIGQNNIVGDESAGDTATTGVLIASAVVPVTGSRIIGNAISNNTYGIWFSHNAASTQVVGNSNTGVTTLLQIEP